MTTVNPINPYDLKLPQPKAVPLLEDQLVDMKFITKLTQLSRSWFYKLIEEGEFPKPIKLGNSSRWLKSEVEQWLSQRILESRGGIKA